MEAGNPEEVYERISAIAYPVFLTTTLTAHSILIICAVFFSPKQMSILRFLLMKTSFLQVLVSLFLFYIQPRLLSGMSLDVPVYCYGMCRKLNNNMLCFALYMFWQTFSLGVAISLTFTLYFKYHRLTSNEPLTRLRVAVSLFVAYIPFFISMVCAVIITLRNSLPDVSAKNQRDEYTEMGKMTLGQLPNKVNFVMLALGIYVAPAVAMWFRWKSHEAMTEKIVGASPMLRFHAKTVMKGLTIQVISHFIFYIPMFSLYIYCIYTNSQIYFQQFFLTLSPNLTATVDPLINLYYVVPYRNQIRRLLGRRALGAPVGVVSVTSNN